MSDKSLASELDAYVKAVSTAGGWPAWDALVARVRDLETEAQADYRRTQEAQAIIAAQAARITELEAALFDAQMTAAAHGSERNALKAENTRIEANLKALCDAAVHWERKARETAERERDAARKAALQEALAAVNDVDTRETTAHVLAIRDLLDACE